MALNDKPNHTGGYDRNRTALIREANTRLLTLPVDAASPLVPWT